MAFLNPAFTRTKIITLKDGRNLQVVGNIGESRQLAEKDQPKRRTVLNMGVRGGCVLYILKAQTIVGTTVEGDLVRINAIPGLLPIWFRSLETDGFEEGTVIGLY